MSLRMKVLLALVCLGLSLSASAANVSVNCNGSKSGTFPSITSALSSLVPAGPNVITVQGTCKENVFIPYYQNLTIQSAPGVTAVIDAANPTDIVFQAFGCRGLVLVNLVIEGGTVGLLINQASEAVIQNVVMKDNSSDGAGVQIASTLGVESSKFINNGGNGLTLGALANVTLATLPTETILFSGNAGAGIAVDASYLQVNFGTVRVEHNAGPAVFVSSGQLVLFGGSSAGAGNVFQNNGEGIDLFDSSSARLFANNFIENNGEVGLQVVNGSSVDLIGFTLPDGSNGATIIGGHSGPGVNVVRSSTATMDGVHVIHRNGSAADPLSSGIRVEHSNLTFLDGATAEGNTGPGITADESSTVNVSAGAVVRGNTADGVRLAIQSNGGFAQPITIAGNGGASIACDTTSVAFGDFTGIKNVECSQVASGVAPTETKRRVVLH